MNISTPLTRRIAAATLTALVGTALLAGCSATAGDVYYHQQAQHLGTLTIAGDKVTYRAVECPGEKPYTDRDGDGELNESKTQIIWENSGRFDGATDVAISKAAVAFAEYSTFYGADTTEGKKAKADWEEDCATAARR